MKKIIIISAIIVALGTALGTAAAWVYHSNEKNTVATSTRSFIGHIPGITEQDISMCRNSYVNGGTYYHQFYNVKLTCERKHVSIDFDHSSEE